MKISKGNYGSITNFGSAGLALVGLVYLSKPGVSTYEDVMANLDTAVGVMLIALAVAFFGIRRAVGKVLTKLDEK